MFSRARANLTCFTIALDALVELGPLLAVAPAELLTLALEAFGVVLSALEPGRRRLELPFLRVRPAPRRGWVAVELGVELAAVAFEVLALGLRQLIQGQAFDVAALEQAA